MKIIKILILIVTVMVLMACSFSVNVPSVQTGVTRTLEINEPVDTQAEVSRVKIEMGAGSLTLAGGAANLVEGTILYNVESWKPTVTKDSELITISQTNTSNVGIPDGNIKNIWDLKLGSTPLELSLATGAYEGNLDLSGLSLKKLTITDGASSSKIRFTSPNPVEMSLLSYKTGASEVHLTGLGYANVREISFDGGVGSYELDFSGELINDINVSINSGMSDVKMVFPEDAHVQVTINGGLSNIDITGTWTVTGSTYEYGTTGPLITVNVEMAVGNLQLIQQ